MEDLVRHKYLSSSSNHQFVLVARDAFDTLLDHAPDKLSIVKKSLIDFVNTHLEILSFSVTDLDKQVSFQP